MEDLDLKAPFKMLISTNTTRQFQKQEIQHLNGLKHKISTLERDILNLLQKPSSIQPESLSLIEFVNQEYKETSKFEDSLFDQTASIKKKVIQLINHLKLPATGSCNCN